MDVSNFRLPRTSKAILLGLTGAVSSCSQVSAEEKVCKADISSVLLNPETAEFYDFQSISSEEATRKLTKMFVDAKTENAPEYASESFVQEGANRVAVALVGTLKSAAPMSYRVRADGKLGNKITTDFTCFAEKEHCLCVDQERAKALLAQPG